VPGGEHAEEFGSPSLLVPDAFDLGLELRASTCGHQRLADCAEQHEQTTQEVIQPEREEIGAQFFVSVLGHDLTCSPVDVIAATRLAR